MAPCSHESLYTDCTAIADRVGFKRPSIERRLLAASTSGKRRRDTFPIPEDVMMNEETFPGPLVLPSDFLTQLDHDTPLYHQSCKVWRGYTRNEVDEDRSKIFVLPPPIFSEPVGEDSDSWDKPIVPESDTGPKLPGWTASSAQLKDLNDYLAAFYHPMTIQQSRIQLKWRPYKGKPPKEGQKYIGLEVPTVRDIFLIRYRPGKDGVSRMQVHAPDLLDAVLNRMPPKAHATVLLVDFDLYNLNDDENNNFTVTKAYGASQIVLVSTFRLHPALDEMQDIDREHMWPASHCKAYADGLIAQEDEIQTAKRLKMSNDEPLESDEPPKSTLALPAAIEAYKKYPESKTVDELTGAWLARVAFAVSRGLGYCFGMEHCTYYACIMQGVSSTRQQSHIPPYLCPICTSKLSWELGPLLDSGPKINLQRRWVKEHAVALKGFCGKRNNVAQFSAFEAWLGKRIEDIENGKLAD
ncbi:hypothetical protein B0J15DRAFT_457235 [Fusarium solani]|uniref:Uncharacterized protein n=1 Tax=Fusarium solani TaxID=169388 RepID=A0A9P9L576_FUSSL|nr:uncharacterized protein B0J15DRAFT_457235 [Fusarium solani]KAH7275040.1 hypothetical protein B0J15DRAFT_457235 [Fusarium solani]